MTMYENGFKCKLIKYFMLIKQWNIWHLITRRWTASELIDSKESHKVINLTQDNMKSVKIDTFCATVSFALLSLRRAWQNM